MESPRVTSAPPDDEPRSRHLTSLVGRVALVTGAGRGIGRAISLELAKAGATLVLVGRGQEALQETAAEATRAGVSTIVIPADLGRSDTPVTVVARALQACGSIDVLINNAARIEPLARPECSDPDVWADTIALNLVAPFRMIRAVLPGMLDRGYGRIVNITSAGSSGTGTPSGSAYASSKAGLEMMTRNVAADLAGEQVRICAVRPGPVDTDMQTYARTISSINSLRASALFNDLYTSGRIRSADGPASFVVSAIREGANGAILDFDFDSDFRPDGSKL